MYFFFWQGVELIFFSSVQNIRQRDDKTVLKCKAATILFSSSLLLFLKNLICIITLYFPKMCALGFSQLSSMSPLIPFP